MRIEYVWDNRAVQFTENSAHYLIFAMMAMLGLDVEILRHEAGHDWEQVFNMDELSR
jgi:hypothetical protein